MSLRKSRRKAWSALLLSATFSASLLSFSGTSDGQQTTNPQQTLETTLQRHQQELEQLLKQHEAQRESLNRKIQSTAATLPVNHQAIEGLHRQMTEIHKRQDKEKQSLAKRHLLESNALRLGINPSGQPTEAEEELDENENGEVEVETSASLRLIDGLDIRDANGVIISGSAELLVTGASFDAEIMIAGLLEANQVSAVEIRDTVTGDVYAVLNGSVLTAITEAAPFVEPEENELAEASPEWAGAVTGQNATERFLDALKKKNLEVIVKSAAHPEGFMKGAFGQIDLDALKEFALDKSSLPEPAVLDRSFRKLGSLNDLVIQDETAAIQLGKALFWDLQVGSDNKTACATCHNFGGADWRSRNQLASGGNQDVTLADFMKNADGRLEDVLGSQGVIQQRYSHVNPQSADVGEAPTAEELKKKFTLDGSVESRTRQVTGRNTPSVINAAFFVRQFWDGRANRFFNGENIFGSQDPNAGVWEHAEGVVTRNTNFLVDYSSLASQAVGPPGSSVEMSHGPDGARSFPDIGKKLLDSSLRPLGLQTVHQSDSVLADLVATDGKGLSVSYAELIRKAFQPRFWNYEAGEVAGHTQMEANFALFFGIAIQAYERTLISDESRFDKFVRGDETQLTFDEQEGFDRFMSGGLSCKTCHGGPMFASGTWSSVGNPVEAMTLANTSEGLYDDGFYNIGVQDQSLDAGIGRMDLPFGPISISKLAAGVTTENQMVAAGQQWPSLRTDFNLPPKVEGMFKSSSLRNVELTAPYFHTGNYATLEDVVNFYARGGDFPNNEHLDDDIHPIGQLEGKPERIAQVAAFMRTLTDERVRLRAAPFDHPELPVPNGHNSGPNGVALDNMVVLEATGAQGTSVAFPMFTDRIGVTTPKSGSSNSNAGSVAQGTAGMTADQLARAKDAQMNQLNQQMNQAQDQFNAETRAVNAQLNSGAITPEQQNAQLADIDARRNARMRQLNDLMAALNSGTNGPASTTGGTMTGGTTTGGTTTGGTTTGGTTTGGTTTGNAPLDLNAPVDPLEPAVPTESFTQFVTGNVVIEDGRPARDRFDVLVTDVPVGVLSNVNGRIVNGVVPEDFAVMVDGMTAEFLDANDNVIAVATAFEAEFQAADLVTLAFSIRDANQLASLSGVSKIRVSQVDPGTLSLVELATVSAVSGSTVAIIAPASGGEPTTGGTTTGGAMTGGATTDQAAISADAQRNLLNQQLNQAQDQFNAETRAVNAQLAAGAITPAQQDAMLADINARRNALVQQINAQMAQVAVVPATGGAANGGAPAGGDPAAPEVDGGIDTVTVVGDVNVQYGFEGPITSANSSGFIVMNRVKVNMASETRPIPGTMGDHDRNPATPDRELNYRQLGRVLTAAGLTYNDLVNHPGLKGYIAKGIGALPPAAAGTNAAIVPAIDPATNDFVEFVFEPRENVLAGKLVQTAGAETQDPADDRFQLGGVAVTSSDLVGFPKVTHAELLAAVGSEITLIGHYMFDRNAFCAREAELPPEGEAPEVALTNGYEGPITAIGAGFVEVMGSRLNVAADVEIPAVTPLDGQQVFRGQDLPFLADNQRGPYRFLPIIGATFAGETLADGNNNVSSVGFIELAENVIVAPVSVQENIVFPQLPGMIAQSVTLSGDERFRGDWMDVGAVPISIGGTTDTIDQVSNATATGMLFGMVGYYDAANDAFWVVEGETEYHPEGTVRITRALGRQGDGEGRMEIRGQVKPAPDSDGTIRIPDTVVINAGAMGTYTLATTQSVDRIPVGVDPLNIPATFANVGTFRISLRTGNQTAGTIVPELVMGEVPGRPEIGDHYRAVDIRDVRAPAGFPVPLEPGVVPATTNLLDALVTADGQVAAGVDAVIESRPGQQRVDIAISAPQSLFGADLFAGLDLTDPEAALAIDPAVLTLTATDAQGNVSEVPVTFLAIPDPDNAGGVLIETSLRGQFAVDLAGRTLNVQLQSGANRITLTSGSLNAGLVFTPGAVVPGVVTTPAGPVTPPVDPVVTPVPVVVIGTPPVAETPVESLLAALTGIVTVDNRIAVQQRIDVDITGVPATALSNVAGLIVNGQIPETFDVAVTGLTAEFLNANGDIVAVSPDFTAVFETATTVAVSLSIRDAAQLTALASVTEVRLVQSVSGVLGVTELVTLPIQGATTELVAVVP